MAGVEGKDILTENATVDGKKPHHVGDVKQPHVARQLHHARREAVVRHNGVGLEAVDQDPVPFHHTRQPLGPTADLVGVQGGGTFQVGSQGGG